MIRRGNLIRKLAIPVLKVSLAVGLIYWFFQCGRLDIKLLVAIGFGIWNVSLLLVGAICVFCGQLLLAGRLLLLARYWKLEVTYIRVLGLTLVEAFFNFVMP